MNETVSLPPRRRGRPLLSDVRASNRIEFVVTTEQHESYRRVAAQSGRTVSAVIRAAVFEKLLNQTAPANTVLRAAPNHRSMTAAQFYGTSLRRARRGCLAMVERVDPDVVYARDGGICQICFTPVPRRGAAMDHRIPLSHGGDHSYANIQTAHRSCNSRKGNR